MPVTPPKRNRTAAAGLQDAGPVRLDPERHRDRAGDGGVVGDLVQQGGAPERPAVDEGLRAFGGVEDELDFAVLDSIDDVRPAFKHLVDLGAGDARSPRGNAGCRWWR